MMKRSVCLVMMAVLAAASFTSCKKEVKPETIVFTTSTNSVGFEADASQMTVCVSSNIGVSVKSLPDWLTAEYSAPSIKKGDTLPPAATTTNIVFKATENEVHEERSGEILIEGVARDGHSAKISVSQKKAPYRFLYTFKGKNIDSPVLSGNNPGATVNWGDNMKDAYKAGLTHSYSSSGEYTISVSINSGSADKVRIEGIKNVSKIDINSF